MSAVQPSAEPSNSTTQRPLVVVSNRLPIQLEEQSGKWEVRPSSGGLATALNGLGAQRTWIGWPGADVKDSDQGAVRDLLQRDGLVPVFLSAREEELYYTGFCNTALWPLFHYFTSWVSYDETEWKTYVAVNERFADAVSECAPEGARVWVHDFHLMLLPALLRARRPDLQIGFFLHIPFPSSEVYRLLPRREELLEGLLGSDYIGFHTSDYAQHFRSSCVRVLGLDVDWERLHWQGRTVGIGAHPIGIDTARFQELAQSPRTAELYREFEASYGGRRIVLGVERLDYTKGLRLKLEAFERFLKADPSRVDRYVLLQVVVPSRLDHPAYKGLKSQVEESIGRINGVCGRPGRAPVHYLHRSLSSEELVALYRLAAVCLVTPVRDGMNLVAQEFVACQAAESELPACNGALVLSEFAGAAHPLGRALLVNPWHTDKVADAIAQALEMPAAERRSRMETMARNVLAMDCNVWAHGFTSALDRMAISNHPTTRSQPLVGALRTELLRAFAAAPSRIVLLDYDGTLRELTAHPDLARPTPEILALLEALSSLPDTEVHVVSGRPRDTLERWFAALPLHLCAEHGGAWRGRSGDWNAASGVQLGWMPRVKEILEAASREVPGTFVEEKSCSVAWHYRLADAEYGPWRARELHSRLNEELANLPTEVMSGRKLVEVRAAGINKGRYVRSATEGLRENAFVLCLGDDRTDLDMYPVLPPGAWSVHVGSAADAARCYVDAPADVRALLRSIVAATGGQLPGSPR